MPRREIRLPVLRFEPRVLTSQFAAVEPHLRSRQRRQRSGSVSYRAAPRAKADKRTRSRSACWNGFANIGISRNSSGTPATP